MIKNNQSFFNRINRLLDATIAFVSLLIAYWLMFYVLPWSVKNYELSWYVYFALCSSALHILVYQLAGFYSLVRSHNLYTVLMRVVFCEFTCLMISIAALFTFKLTEISRMVLVMDFVLATGLISGKHVITRLILRNYRRKGFNLKHVLLIGSGETAKRYFDMTRTHREYGYNVLGYIGGDDGPEGLARLGGYGDIAPMLEKHSPDETVIALPAEDYRWMEGVISACETAGAHLHIIPCYDKYISSAMDVDTLEGINLVNIRRIPLSYVGNAFVKRTADILLSLMALIITSPVMLAAAIGVRLGSPGPVIFKQKRVGKDKREFYMYKFRSMRVNDREQTGWSTTGDERKTAFGALLRRYSIDEFPQFWNVLRGDMSIVGPRPEVPFYVERFKNEIPLYMIKHYVRPGITGWAQVNGLRGDTSIKRRIEYDIYYIENWTWAFDLRVMLLTIFKMKNGEAASREKAKSA